MEPNEIDAEDDSSFRMLLNFSSNSKLSDGIVNVKDGCSLQAFLKFGTVGSDESGNWLSASTHVQVASRINSCAGWSIPLLGEAISAIEEEAECSFTVGVPEVVFAELEDRVAAATDWGSPTSAAPE